MVEVEEIAEPYESTTEVEALMRTNITSFEQYIKLNKKIPQEVFQAVSTMTDPGRLADNLASHLAIKIEEKQPLLEIIHPVRRLEKVLYVMQREIEVLQIEERIKNRVKKQMEKTQSEYYLNEQMRAIQKEMGEKDDFRANSKNLKSRSKRNASAPKPPPRCARSSKSSS